MKKTTTRRSDAGIYIIVSPKGKVYVGQSVNLRKRKYEHFRLLRSQKHSNKHLQRAYNKYNGDLEFYVIEYISDISILTEREQYWMDAFNSYDCGYNQTVAADSSVGITRTEEQRKVTSKIVKSLWQDAEFVSKVKSSRQKYLDKPETRLKMSEASKEAARNDPERCARHSEIMKEKCASAEYRDMFLERMKSWRESVGSFHLSEIAKKRMSSMTEQDWEVVVTKRMITQLTKSQPDNGVMWIQSKTRKGVKILTAVARWTELSGENKVKMFSTNKYGLLPAWKMAVEYRLEVNSRLLQEYTEKLKLLT